MEEDWLSKPLCWKFLKIEEVVAECKGNWQNFGVETITKEPPSHASEWHYCREVMLAALQWRGEEFRGEMRQSQMAVAGAMPCAVPHLCDWIEESQLWDTSPGGLACPQSCGSPPEAQVFMAPINFSFCVLEVVINVDQSFLLWVNDLKNHKTCHVWN